MKRLKIAVLRGGPSSEFDVSLKTGKSIIDTLSNNHEVFDVVIDRNTDWYVDGQKVKPEIFSRSLDFVFNGMHGEYGEDGQIQELLEKLRVKYSGPKKLAAAISMNKNIAKDYYRKNNIKTPAHLIIETNKIDEITPGDIVKHFAFPVIIKPLGAGSSIGISIAKNFPELMDHLPNYVEKFDKLMIEEMIFGKEATVGVIDKFRNRATYPLMPIEIKKPKGRDLFDYDLKYSGEVEENCPGNFSQEEKRDLERMAIEAHEALGLRHYSRSDFIVHPKRGVFILETNSLPGITEESLLPKALEASGSSLEEFLHHILEI
jgi:D-alanine-D-alanine ligase